MQRTTCNARWRGARRQQLLSDEPLSPLSSDGPCCYRRRPAERTPRASYCNSRETSAAHSGTTRSDSKAHRLVGRDVRRLLVAVVPAARTVGHVAAPGRSRPPRLALYIAVRCRPNRCTATATGGVGGNGLLAARMPYVWAVPCCERAEPAVPCDAIGRYYEHATHPLVLQRVTRSAMNAAKCPGGCCAHTAEPPPTHALFGAVLGKHEVCHVVPCQRRLRTRRPASAALCPKPLT